MLSLLRTFKKNQVSKLLAHMSLISNSRVCLPCYVQVFLLEEIMYHEKFLCSVFVFFFFSFVANRTKSLRSKKYIGNNWKTFLKYVLIIFRLIRVLKGYFFTCTFRTWSNYERICENLPTIKILHRKVSFLLKYVPE